jgi:hypothetical protein
VHHDYIAKIEVEVFPVFSNLGGIWILGIFWGLLVKLIYRGEFTLKGFQRKLSLWKSSILKGYLSLSHPPTSDCGKINRWTEKIHCWS